MTRVILDISRLFTRARHAVPTGIDRVELAYAGHYLEAPSETRAFALSLPGLPTGIVPDWRAAGLIKALARRWSEGAGRGPSGSTLAGLAAAALAPMGGRRRALPPSLYLNVSHHHLDEVGTIRRFLAREQARFVCFIHDLVPIAFPEYARPGIPGRHERRLAGAGTVADAILVNSADTEAALRRHLRARGIAPPPIVVVPLGVDPPTDEAPAPAPLQPYFVALGTIEPRKNHLLLLQIWRRLVECHGERAPRLVVVGRRGWENEMVIDLLDRCPALRGHVEERSVLSDGAVRRLLQGARALLMPSFAEGYGLPVAEALALGVPVLASPLPALIEVGAGVPEFIDPLDGPGWLAAIEAYAQASSLRRNDQRERLRHWRRPTWQAHLNRVDETLRAVLAGVGASLLPVD